MIFRERLEKDTPVFLAPMAGVTDGPFRELVYGFGATAVVSEMISSEALVRQSRKAYKRLLGTEERERKDAAGNNPLKIIQLVGKDPERMVESAIINENLGADVIDINIGCPARKVVSNNSGAALMKDENLAIKIAESIVKAVKIPVTVKMRLGWNSEQINCLSLARKFEDVGIRMLAIHCRTRSQAYGGNADWSAIGGLRDIIKIPYLCNGDIRSPEDAAHALKESLSDGVMVGRAALGRPWLLNQIMRFFDSGKIVPPPSVEEQFSTVMKHFQSVLNYYGTAQGIKVFRKHFCWYSHGMAGSANFRENINCAKDLYFIKSCVRDFYERHFGDILKSIEESVCPIQGRI
jgi:tRNA-dihydrouridine synthase B